MSKYHPLPWRVAYYSKRIATTWDDRAGPRVVDAKGKTVVTPPQYVYHPGLYDEQADATCHEIVAAVNAHHVTLTIERVDLDSVKEN